MLEVTENYYARRNRDGEISLRATGGQPGLSRETGPDAQPMYCLRCLRLCLSGKCADYPDRRPTKYAHRQLYLGRCIYCGRCEEVCPTRAIQLTNNFELTVTNKADLYTRATFHLQRCSRCERPFAPQNRRTGCRTVGTATKCATKPRNVVGASEHLPGMQTTRDADQRRYRCTAGG